MPLSPTQAAYLREAYFGPIDQYLAWHDGFVADTAFLAGLDPAGQQQAAQELLAALRSGQADARPILGLAFLRREEALPLLHDYLRRGRYALYALEAIAHINAAGLCQSLVLARLQPAGGWTQLIEVVMGLRYFSVAQLSAPVLAQLLVLLRHGELLVRSHALTTLRQLFGLPEPVHPAPDPLARLLYRRWRPCGYRKAQALLLAQLPPAEAARLRQAAA